jgi:mevalonate kinase
MAKKQVAISVPQSLIILGDYGVKYDKSTLLTAIEPRVEIEIEKSKQKIAKVKIPQKNLNINISQQTPIFPQRTSRQIRNIVKFVHQIYIDSELPFGFFLNLKNISDLPNYSISESVIVAVIKGLAILQNIEISRKEILQTCFDHLQKAEIDFAKHKIAAAIYGKTIYFDPKKQVEQIKTSNYSLLKIEQKNNQRKVFKKVLAYIEKKKKKYEPNFVSIAHLSYLGGQAFRNDDFAEFGRLMNRSQKYFQDLGLVSNPFHKTCVKAMLWGADGAKTSQEFNDGILVLAKNYQEELFKNLAKNKIDHQVFQTHQGGVRMEIFS